MIFCTSAEPVMRIGLLEGRMAYVGLFFVCVAEFIDHWVYHQGLGLQLDTSVKWQMKYAGMSDLLYTLTG
jgi:hypothetical protein